MIIYNSLLVVTVSVLCIYLYMYYKAFSFYKDSYQEANEGWGRCIDVIKDAAFVVAAQGLALERNNIKVEQEDIDKAKECLKKTTCLETTSAQDESPVLSNVE